MSNPCTKEIAKAQANSLIETLFGGGSAPAAVAPSGPVVTLRYGPLVTSIPVAQIGGRSIGDLFRDSSEALGGLDLSSAVTIRDTRPGQGVISEDTSPVNGVEYVASVRKEDKGR